MPTSASVKGSKAGDTLELSYLAALIDHRAYRQLDNADRSE